MSLKIEKYPSQFNQKRPNRPVRALPLKFFAGSVLLVLVGLAVLLTSCSSTKEEDWWEIRQKEQQAEQAKAEAEKQKEEAKPEEPKEEVAKEEPKPKEEEPKPEPEPVAVAEPEPKPEPEPVAEKPEGLLFKDVFPRDFQMMKPLRIGILSSPKNPAMGEKVAFGLTEIQGFQLESRLGRKVEVAYISRSSRLNGNNTQIRYRPLYLREAMHIAAAMPKDQVVASMNPGELKKQGVDLVIYLSDMLR